MLGILSFEQIRLVSEFCKRMMLHHENMVFVCALNKNGRIIDMEKRDSTVLSTLSKHEFEIVFMQRILQASMMRDLDEKLGKLSFAILERDYYTECLIPFHDGAILAFFDSPDVRESATEMITHVHNLDLKIQTKIAC